MNRRDMLKMIVTATGTAFIGAKVFAYELTSATPVAKTGFTVNDIALMNEIGEVIIPKTDTPGAKAADVGSIMAVMVADCFTADEQETFTTGLVKLQTSAKDAYNSDFMLLSNDKKMALLTSLDKEALSYNAKRESKEDMPHYFSIIKQQVLFGFFTSKIGATKVLRYVAIPGSYDGYYPYKEGDKAWAT